MMEVLRCGRWHVQNNLLRKGELQAVKSGRKTLIIGSSLRRYIRDLPKASYAKPYRASAQPAEAAE
ncbi:MAG TPA: helix-turn-helix domain-containing protein [Methylocella sp.]|nr:helix-turn-helix domain-containing protein [Methylocella sp.]